MRITFLSPPPNLSGGERVIAIYAQKLAERGHEVEVVCFQPRRPSAVRAMKDVVKGRGWPKRIKHLDTHYDNHEINYRVVDHPGPIRESDIANGDVVIATWWETAEWASALSHAKGSKVYFVQHHEVHDHLPQERVRESYRLPLRKVCVSDWLSGVMANEYGEHASATAANAVDCEHFTAPSRYKNPSLTVGFMYGGSDFKGADLALQAIEIARESINVRVIAFANRHPSDKRRLRAIDEFHASPRQDHIPDIYASCDAWLFSSRAEGFGLPILEAMACRTPVIGTPAGAAPELIGQGGGILVNPEDPEDMARAMVKVARMSPEHWQTMSEAAYRTATSYTWDNATDKFEAALFAAVDGTWDETYCVRTKCEEQVVL